MITSISGNFSSAATPLLGRRAQQLGLMRHRHGDVDELAHAARQGRDRVVAIFTEAKAFEQVLEAGHHRARTRRPPRRHALVIGDAERHQQVLLGGQAGEKLRDLEGAADPLPAHTARSKPGDVGAVEHDAPGIGAQIAGDDVDEGGLAGAVVADETQSFAAARRPRCPSRR
jgi:hypothetical protein